jgi:hypothetical protein
VFSCAFLPPRRLFLHLSRTRAGRTIIPYRDDDPIQPVSFGCRRHGLSSYAIEDDVQYPVDAYPVAGAYPATELPCNGRYPATDDYPVTGSYPADDHYPVADRIHVTDAYPTDPESGKPKGGVATKRKSK